MRRDLAMQLAPRRQSAAVSGPTKQGATGVADQWPVRPNAREVLAPVREKPVRTVLAAVDGTPFGEHALPLAAAVAERAGAALRVAHVFSAREEAGEAAHAPAGTRRVIDRQRRRGEYLDGLVRRLARHNPLPVTADLLLGGDVAETVCEASAAADLVVMTTRGRGAWARFWRGSVTAAVVRRARCPVLLVRGRDDRSDLAVARLPQDILIPLDGTGRGEEAIRSAVALGSAGATYHLLHVVRAWDFSGAGAHGWGLTPLPGEMPLVNADDYLCGVASRLAGSGGAVTARVVIDDRPVVDAIAEYAERIGAEVVAMTTRGRGRLCRGSVANEVAGRVDVPVHLTRPGEANAPTLRT